MQQTSKTGLTASPTKAIYKRSIAKNVQLKAVVTPAPLILKPFAGLYNPYASGCSLLCNHPMEKEAKKLFRKAKENWANEDKRNPWLAEEIEAIKAQFCGGAQTPTQVESVPEELFRRYTDTDSRPLTPAPTLASAATYASGSRRCITPGGCSRHQKTQLVLDLRRSHSQETLPFSGCLHDTPLDRIQQVPTRAASLEEMASHTWNFSLNEQSPRKVKTALCKINFTGVKSEKLTEEDEGRNEMANEEDDCVKRRGKRRKKKNSLRGVPAFQVSTDPETQVAAIGTDSGSRSARTSIIPSQTPQERAEPSSKNAPMKEIASFLDADILRQFGRDLNEEMLDSELNPYRRQALEEAFRALARDKPACKKLQNLQKELKVPKPNTDLWMSLPRNFSRSSARFELPMSGQMLAGMTSLQYVQEYVSVSPERKLLFNCVFNKFKTESTEIERRLPGHLLQDALDLLMGRRMTPEEMTRFRRFIDWNDFLDFRTFCGIAALCERIMAPVYCARLADRKSDPCHEVEAADFETLTRKINGQVIDGKLLEVLNAIKVL